MSVTVSVDRLASAIEEEFERYRGLTADCVKKAVRDAGKTVTKKINDTAPEKTGQYAKSWKSKVTAEDSQSISVTVYSPTRYMLAHLLEHGHVKRNGGRVRAIPHIAPAQEEAEKQLVNDIERGLRNG